MIRDIRTSKPEHLKVSCHRGGKVTDINQELSQYEAKYDKVAIVIGTNDSDDEKATTTAISENFKNLICEAKRVGTKVILSSILPRPKPRSGTSHIKTLQVNKELKQMCDLDFQCHFVNNDRNFTLNDKTSNDALYLRDGIHLHSMGSEKLVDNLELRNLAFVQKPASRISYPNHGHFPFSANRVDLHPYDRPPPVIENPARSVRSAPRPAKPVKQWTISSRPQVAKVQRAGHRIQNCAFK